MSSTGAARQRRHRERTAVGRIVLPVEVDEVRLAEVLADAGLIGADHDRGELAAVLSRWVDLLMTRYEHERWGEA